MPIDRQQAFSGMAEADLPTEALSNYLADHLEGFAPPLTVARFKGGQSNPTYQLETPGKSYVLRRKPFGKLLPSAHAVEREYQVTRALADAGYPVAVPRLLCQDETVIGATFFVMDFVSGRVFWQPFAPGLSAGDRASLFADMNGAIARLHEIDYKALGLVGFGKPEGYVSRQIRRWTG
jgi:aminoglycoside phosphotransferase (APT) family kinase protein